MRADDALLLAGWVLETFVKTARGAHIRGSRCAQRIMCSSSRRQRGGDDAATRLAPRALGAAHVDAPGVLGAAGMGARGELTWRGLAAVGAGAWRAAEHHPPARRHVCAANPLCFPTAIEQWFIPTSS